MRINRSLITFLPDTGAGSGTVTSVALTAPSIFFVLGTPITTSGTLQLGLVNQFANTFWAGPIGGAEDVPTFRSLVSDDIPNLDMSKITTGSLGVDRGGTGASSLTGILIGNGISPITATSSSTPNQVLRVDSLGTGYEWFDPDYMSNPMVELGDMIYGNAVGLPIRVQPNRSTTQKFLSMTGDGTNGAAPRWETISDAAINSLFQIDYDTSIIGSRNSINTIFQSSVAFYANTTRLYKNGVRLQRGAGYDYVELSSNQVQFSIAPDDGDLLTLEYIKSDATVSGDYQIDYDASVVGDRDSVNAFYTTTFNFTPGSTRVFKNGLRMTRGASYDYTEYSSNTKQFAQAPDNGDLLIIEYIKS